MIKRQFLQMLESRGQNTKSILINNNNNPTNDDSGDTAAERGSKGHHPIQQNFFQKFSTRTDVTRSPATALQARQNQDFLSEF